MGEPDESDSDESQGAVSDDPRPRRQEPIDDSDVSSVLSSSDSESESNDDSDPEGLPSWTNKEQARRRVHEPDEDDDAEFVVPFFCAYEDEFERLRRWILRDSEGQLGRALASAAQKDASIQALRVELAQSQAASEEQRAEIGRLKARVEQLDDSAQYWFNKRDEAVESLDRVREERDQLREERDGLREELRQEKDDREDLEGQLAQQWNELEDQSVSGCEPWNPESTRH